MRSLKCLLAFYLYNSLKILVCFDLFNFNFFNVGFANHLLALNILQVKQRGDVFNRYKLLVHLAPLVLQMELHALLIKYKSMVYNLSSGCNSIGLL